MIIYWYMSKPPAQTNKKIKTHSCLLILIEFLCLSCVSNVKTPPKKHLPTIAFFIPKEFVLPSVTKSQKMSFEILISLKFFENWDEFLGFLWEFWGFQSWLSLVLRCKTFTDHKFVLSELLFQGLRTPIKSHF